MKKYNQIILVKLKKNSKIKLKIYKLKIIKANTKIKISL